MKYYNRNEDALQNEKNTLEKQANAWGNNAPMLYLLNGSTMVRILPAYSEAGLFFHKIVKHRVKVGDKVEVFTCPAGMANMPCLVCEKGQELTESKDEVQMKFARENLRPRTHYLYNVLCYAAPSDSRGSTPEFGKVYVMEGGIMVHRQIISLDQDSYAGWADITNLETGVTLVIKRIGQGLDTKYEVNPHGAGKSNLVVDCQARGIDLNSLQLFNLEEVYALPPEDKLSAVVSRLNIKTITGVAPQPVLQTVSPTVAAATPVAPVVESPVPVAAPPAPQPAQAAPNTVPMPQSTTAAPVPAEPPKPPVIPPPPTEN